MCSATCPYVDCFRRVYPVEGSALRTKPEVVNRKESDTEVVSPQ